VVPWHFHWNELMTRNPEQAKSFYGATVGWTFEPMPMPDGTYWVARRVRTRRPASSAGAPQFDRRARAVDGIP